jgi:hypothetical protein
MSLTTLRNLLLQSYASSSTGGIVVLLFGVQETDGELVIVVFVDTILVPGTDPFTLCCNIT